MKMPVLCIKKYQVPLVTENYNVHICRYFIYSPVMSLDEDWIKFFKQTISFRSVILVSKRQTVDSLKL